MMIGHPPDSIAAVQQAFIHIISTRRTSNALPKNIMQQNRETVKEEEAHFESSAMTSVIFQIYDDAS